MLKVTLVHKVAYHGTATRDEVIAAIRGVWNADPGVVEAKTDEDLTELLGDMLKKGSYSTMAYLSEIAKREDDYEIVKEKVLLNPIE